MRAIFSLLVAAIVFSSCKKEPEACFETSNSKYVYGETIQFTNCSVDADSYEWNFGDGESDVIAEPSHQYESTGEYDVLLRALRDNGKESTTNNKITVGYWKLSSVVVENTDIGLEKGYGNNFRSRLRIHFGLGSLYEELTISPGKLYLNAEQKLSFGANLSSEIIAETYLDGYPNVSSGKFNARDEITLSNSTLVKEVEDSEGDIILKVTLNYILEP